MIFKMACFIKKIFGVCCGDGKNLLFLVAAFLCAMLPEHADAQYYSIGNKFVSLRNTTHNIKTGITNKLFQKNVNVGDRSFILYFKAFEYP